jgi:hypothetical protein
MLARHEEFRAVTLFFELVYPLTGMPEPFLPFHEYLWLRKKGIDHADI